MQEAVSRILAVNAAANDFAYIPGEAGGQGRILQGFVILAALKGEQLIDSELIFGALSKLCLEEIPSKTIDPLGYALAINPLIQQPSYLAQADPRQLRVFVADSKNWNPIFRATIEDTLESLNGLCVNELVDGVSRIVDSTVAHRIWQQTLHLRAPIFSSLKNANIVREQALSVLAERHPNILKRVHGNAMSPDIDRKGATVTPHFQKWLRRGCAKSQEDCARLRDVLAVAANSDRLLQRDLDANRDGMKTLSARRSGAFFALSAMQPPRCIGRATFELILDRSSRPSCEGSAYVAIMAAGFLFHGQIGEAEITPIDDDFSLLSTSVGITSGPPPSPELHYYSGPTFSRLVPRHIGESFLFYRRRVSREGFMSSAQSWLRSVHRNASLAKLRYCLRFNSPVWFGFPPVFTELGLNPHGKSY